MNKGRNAPPCAIRIGQLGQDRQISIPPLNGVLTLPSDMSTLPDGGVFEIPLTESACTDGWYAAECDDQAVFRWTGPDQIAVMELHLAPRDYAMHIAYDRPAALADEDFSVSANGQALAVQVDAINATSREAHFIIPAEAIIDGVLRLAIDVGAVVCLHEHGGADARALGIVVHRILLATKPAWPCKAHIRAANLRFGGQEPESWGFRKSALLHIPTMLDLPARTNGAFTEIAIDVAAQVFATKPTCVWELEIWLRDKIVGTVSFRNFTNHHQIILPTSLFYETTNTLRLTARAVAGPRIVPRFFVRVLVVHKDRLVDAIERSSVWVFSTARSGSSWLSQDILCHSHDTRSMDEPGFGRMFAPVDWVAERFYDLAYKDAWAQSGLHYETKAKTRADTGFIPPFERSFMFGGRETNIWSSQNRRMYLDLIRTTVFDHVMHEWGAIDYGHVVFKMPNDSHAADIIMQALPRAFMVMLMRDGRDVMKSRFSPFASPDLATTTDRRLRLHAIAFYAHLWNFQVDIIQAAYDAHDPARRLKLSYEDLRIKPTAQLRSLFDQIGMPMSDADLAALVIRTTLENMPDAEKGPDKPRQTGQIGKFAEVFSDAEIALMDAIMGPNLRRNGYAAASRRDGALTVPGDLVLSADKIAQHEGGEFEISLTEDVFGAGWYRVEFDEASPFRWTGPDQVAEISLRLAERDYALHINYDLPFAQSEEQFLVAANRVPLEVTVANLGHLSRQAHFLIPAAVIAARGGEVHLQIDVGAMRRPADHGGTDTRTLGVVVFRVSFTPGEKLPAQWEQVGEAEGLSIDRWVGPALRLTIQPDRPVRRVTVHGWCHDDTPHDGEIVLRIADQAATHPMAPGMFALSVDLDDETIEPLALRVEASDWMMFEGPKGREMAFVLQRVEVG